MKRLWLISCMLVIAMCVKAQSDNLIDKAVRQNADKQSTGKFDYIFQEAVRQKLAQHYAEAIDLFDYCHRLNPESGAVMYELANLYRYVRNDSLSTVMLEKACKLYPDNYWYKLHLVYLYENQRRNDDVLCTLEDMAQQFPEKEEVLMMLLDVYQQNNDYENIVKVLDKMELKEGKSEQLSMDKFRLFLQMNDEERAFEEMTELANEYPNDLRYQVVIGDLYFDAGKKEEALKQFKMVEEKDSNNVTLLLSMSNYYHDEGDTLMYHKYLSKLISNPSFDDASKARLFGVLIREDLNNQQSDSTVLLNLFDEALQQPQEDADLLELRVRYMITKDMPAKEIKTYLYKILDVDPENSMARQQLLAYAIDDNDTIGIVNICKTAVDYNIEDPVFYYYLGIAYFNLEEYDKAIEAFRGGLEHVEDGAANNKVQLYVNMYSLLGDLYHKIGQDDKAFQAYDSCLIYKQDEPAVLNNYAYYLSLKKKDLDRAEKMSHKANELEPDNPTYLDTYAWVLYQMKRYEEAKLYMDRVVELMDAEELKESEDVLEHIDMINKKVKNKK